MAEDENSQGGQAAAEPLDQTTAETVEIQKGDPGAESK